ncbi:MAG: caspase, EACC1-associated type [Phormidesmis sp.]
MAKKALLIGVSKYDRAHDRALSPLPAATNDVEAMYRVLIAPDLGGFDQVKVLADPDCQSMKDEIETLFTGCSQDDLVLLFFSGHGLKDEKNQLYFATRITRKNAKGGLSRSTAVPAQFIHEIMAYSRARQQAIILDCCFSGAFDPALQAKDDGSFDLQGQLGAEGRVVLASSNATQYSCEHKRAGLSIYTRHLIEGIETGAGDLNQDGQVSILELHEYATKKVQEDISDVTPKLVIVKDKGWEDKGWEIILSKTRAKGDQSPDTKKQEIDLGEVLLESRSEEDTAYNAIPSLLLPLKPLIERLIEQLKNYCFSHSRAGDVSSAVTTGDTLELIRLASNADWVFLMSQSEGQNSWQLKAQSRLSREIDSGDYTEMLKAEVLASIASESVFMAGHHGTYRIVYDETTEAAKAFILIPLDSSNDPEFIGVCGLSKDSHYLNDACTKIITSFYSAAQCFHAYPHWQPSRVEASILDDLKRDHGFLPLSFYNRRFELFCDRLSQIVIYFEPILDLRKVAITGWEALARDPLSLRAPVDLFEAAELWGSRFIVQLDMQLLKLAATSYRQAGLNARRNRRVNEISPLSVNVYPESLMRSAYFKTVREITTPDKNGYTLLPSDSLVLEISEKADLPAYQDGVRLKFPLEVFKAKLIQYVRELRIQFGIDDFGVGYASVSRLAGLRPPHVKIDREILHQQQAEIIIRFVREIVTKSSELHLAKIVVEGLDEHSPITLHQLHKLGVAYAQGYIIGKAEPKIYRLTSEKRKFLIRSIQGDPMEH